MAELALHECFHLLGLGPSAGPKEVQASFRRLARVHHPDVRRTPDSSTAFVQIVRAYKTIQRTLRHQGVEQTKRLCPLCRRLAELFDGPGGGAACVDCLLGITRRRFILPFPSLETVKHVSVIAIEAVSACSLVAALGTGSPTYTLISLSSAALALLLLAVTCVRIPHVK